MDFKKELNSDISKDILTLTTKITDLEETNKKLLDNKTVVVFDQLYRVNIDKSNYSVETRGEIEEKIKSLIEQLHETISVYNRSSDESVASYDKANEHWDKVKHITDKWWYKLFY